MFCYNRSVVTDSNTDPMGYHVMFIKILNKPPSTPYNNIIIRTFGDHVDKKNPTAAKIAPNIATARDPNSLRRTLDIVPTRNKLMDLTTY